MTFNPSPPKEPQSPESLPADPGTPGTAGSPVEPVDEAADPTLPAEAFSAGLPSSSLARSVPSAGASAQAAQTSADGSNGKSPIEAVRKPSFLYVDDDPMSREVMLLLMKNVLGYDQITIFDRNDDFMKRVRDLPAVPDVVFLDIQMVPYDGYTMLRMLRDDPTYAECRIIAMTASVMATDVEALRKAGFDGLIGKPIMHRVFPDLLKQILTGEMVWFIA